MPNSFSSLKFLSTKLLLIKPNEVSWWGPIFVLIFHKLFPESQELGNTWGKNSQIILFITITLLYHVSNTSSGRSPYGVAANKLDCDIIVSSNSCYTITFNLVLILLGKIRNLLSLLVMGDLNHYCSSIRMDLALNNPQRLMCN